MRLLPSYQNESGFRTLEHSRRAPSGRLVDDTTMTRFGNMGAPEWIWGRKTRDSRSETPLPQRTRVFTTDGFRVRWRRRRRLELFLAPFATTRVHTPVRESVAF